MDLETLNIKETQNALNNEIGISNTLKNKKQYLIKCLTLYYQSLASGSGHLSKNENVRSIKDASWKLRKKFFKDVLGYKERYEEYDDMIKNASFLNNNCYDITEELNPHKKKINKYLQKAYKLKENAATHILCPQNTENTLTLPSIQKNINSSLSYSKSCQKISGTIQSINMSQTIIPDPNIKINEFKLNLLQDLQNSKKKHEQSILEKSGEKLKELQTAINKTNNIIETTKKKFSKKVTDKETEQNYFVSIEVKEFHPDIIKKKIGLTLPALKKDVKKNDETTERKIISSMISKKINPHSRRHHYMKDLTAKKSFYKASHKSMTKERLETKKLLDSCDSIKESNHELKKKIDFNYIKEEDILDEFAEKLNTVNFENNSLIFSRRYFEDFIQDGEHLTSNSSSLNIF